MAKKIKSPQELRVLRNWLKSETDVRTSPKELQITIHMGTCGIAAGAREVMAQLVNELSGAAIDNVTLKQSGCIGMCEKEPMLTLVDQAGQQFRYGHLDKGKVRHIVADHLLDGKPVPAYLITT